MTNPSSELVELRVKLRMVISHASGGHLSEPEDIDRSTNDICVEISRNRNEVFQHGKEVGAREANTRISSTVPSSELVERLRQLRVVLKSGDYDGADLMRAWCAMAEAADYIESIGSSTEDGLRKRIVLLEMMVADHPMVPARDQELNSLLCRADRMPKATVNTHGKIPRAIDWERMEPIERAIRRCLIDTEELGAHRLLTDTVVLLERAQQRVAAWINLGKPGSAALSSHGKGK